MVTVKTIRCNACKGRGSTKSTPRPYTNRLNQPKMTRQVEYECDVCWGSGRVPVKRAPEVKS